MLVKLVVLTWANLEEILSVLDVQALAQFLDKSQIVGNVLPGKEVFVQQVENEVESRLNIIASTFVITST